MSPEESVRLRNIVVSQMAAEGYPIATEDLRASHVQGRSYPIRSIVNPPWAPSKKDIMTEKEADDLRRLMIDKVGPTMEQDWISSMAASFENSNSENSPAPQATIGNLDGASKSVAVVTPEKEAPLGEQATIVQPEKSDETILKTLLAADPEGPAIGESRAGEYCPQLNEGDLLI